jgi:hypothetical protein
VGRWGGGVVSRLKSPFQLLDMMDWQMNRSTPVWDNNEEDTAKRDELHPRASSLCSFFGKLEGGGQQNSLPTMHSSLALLKVAGGWGNHLNRVHRSV